MNIKIKKQIIQALKCKTNEDSACACGENENCRYLTKNDCEEYIMRDALKLIEAQENEISGLKSAIRSALETFSRMETLYKIGKQKITDKGYSKTEVCNYEETHMGNDGEEVAWVCDKCGETWTLTEGGTPEDHNMHYCPQCGAKIIGCIPRGKLS